MLLTWLKQLFASRVAPDPAPLVESPPVREPTEREQGMLLNSELKSYSDPQINASMAGLVRIETIRPNIVAFTDLLKELNATLRKEGTILTAQRCNFTEATVSVGAFFQKDGFYIPYSKVLDFQKEAEVFYALTQACQDATVGPHEHNYRMLTRVFVSLKSVNIGLLETLIHSAE